MGLRRVRRRSRLFTGGSGLAAAGLVAGLLAAVAGAASGQVAPTSTTFYNTIWAGYAAKGAAGTFDSVAASWTQPTVTCSSGETSYSTYWVGLDGYNSRTVEQVGTAADCVNGEAEYYAWYEMYPKSGAMIPLTISPLDSISASVDYAASAGGHGPGTFTLALNDETTGKSLSVTVRSPSAQLSSAEVIVEAPSSNHGPFGALPLSDFGTVSFSGATVGTATGSETLAAASPDELIVTANGTASGLVEATPNDSLSGGTFTVTRQNS